jgi:hypothetical protein
VGKAKMGPIRILPQVAKRFEVKIEGTDIIVTIP